MMMEDMDHQINAFWVNKLLTLEESRIQSALTEKTSKDRQ